MKKMIALAAALCLAATLLAGCGTAYQDQPTGIPQATLDVLPQPSDGNASTTTNENGTTVIHRGEDLDLPEGFPSDKVPVYAGSSCTYSMSVTNPEDSTYSYTIKWVSEDTSDKAAAFYKEELTGQPDYYEYLGEADGKAGTYMYSATVDGLSMNIMINPVTDGLGQTEIMLVLSNEAPVG